MTPNPNRLRQKVQKSISGSGLIITKHDPWTPSQSGNSVHDDFVRTVAYLCLTYIISCI